MRVKIIDQQLFGQTKDGKDLIDKYGKPYFRAVLKFLDGGQEKTASGFVYTTDWKGQEVELELYEEEFKGKNYLKFRIPRKFQITKDMWDLLNMRVDNIENKLSEKVINEDIGAADIPF